MANTISSTQASNAAENLQPTRTRQQTQTSQTQKTASLPQDTVTLKSSGDADHDGDSK